MDDSIIAQVFLRSGNGTSILETDESITSENVESHRVDEEIIEKATSILQDLGFEVVQTSEVGVTISGDKEQYETAFETTLKLRSAENDSEAPRGQVPEATEPIRIPDELSPFVEEISFPTPPEFY